DDEDTRVRWQELNQNTALENPDYSEEAFDQAWENPKEGWKDSGREVMTSPTIAQMGLSPVNTEEQGRAAEQERRGGGGGGWGGGGSSGPGPGNGGGGGAGGGKVWG
ncbi:hypothetical protein ADK57_17400, partial [Streptomyces sp. MMG1533]